MRILVFSDSHGRSAPVENAIAAHGEAKTVIFLGDGARELLHLTEIFPDRTFLFVRGNCDFGGDLPSSGEIKVEGRTVFYTHGHEYSVGLSTDRLEKAARARGADIVLYGHTHIARIEYRDGLYIVNPGSVAHPREGGCSFAMIDILPSGIVPIIADIR